MALILPAFRAFSEVFCTNNRMIKNSWALALFAGYEPLLFKSSWFTAVYLYLQYNFFTSKTKGVTEGISIFGQSREQDYRRPVMCSRISVSSQDSTPLKSHSMAKSHGKMYLANLSKGVFNREVLFDHHRCFARTEWRRLFICKAILLVTSQLFRDLDRWRHEGRWP